MFTAISIMCAGMVVLNIASSGAQLSGLRMAAFGEVQDKIAFWTIAGVLAAGHI